MIIENLTTLKINQLTKAQYKAALAAGTVNENELYMTEETNADLTDFANHTLITIPAGRMRGDVDGDGKITFTDGDIVQDHSGHTSPITDEIALWCADVTLDGKINVIDANQIKMFALGNANYLTYTPSMADYYNNWTYQKIDDTSGQFYTDIPITGMTANSSASVIVKGIYESGFFTKAECVEGAIRIYAKLCPISALTAVVSWGTGDGTAVITTESEDLTAYALKPTITTTTLLASNWDSSAKTYSFETDYPNASYDIEVALDSTATAEQAEAFNGAQIVGSTTSNIIKAYGNVPTVDIPVILKVVTK